MNMPFVMLVEAADIMRETPDSPERPIGVLAALWNEPAARIEDAIDAVKMLKGEIVYIGIPRAETPKNGKVQSERNQQSDAGIRIPESTP